MGAASRGAGRFGLNIAAFIKHSTLRFIQSVPLIENYTLSCKLLMSPKKKSELSDDEIYETKPFKFVTGSCYPTILLDI